MKMSKTTDSKKTYENLEAMYIMAMYTCLCDDPENEDDYVELIEMFDEFVRDIKQVQKDCQADLSNALKLAIQAREALEKDYEKEYGSYK